MAKVAQDSIRNALGFAWTAQLADLQRHLPGAQAGTDSEELHQFRVALRKTRALLKLFRKILPQAEQFKDDLKWLAGATGKTRDLDVLTAHAQHSATALSVTAANVTPIIDELHSERAAAQKALSAVLRGNRTRDLLESWRRFLETLPTRTDLAPAADIPAWTALEPLILKESLRMLQECLSIDSDTDPHCLHELRIRGKRLRYLLESFEQSTESDKVKPLTKKLRNLQTQLGGHQDAIVAAQRWRELIDTLKQRGDVDAATIALLENWEAAEVERQRECREELPRALRKLAKASGYLCVEVQT